MFFYLELAKLNLTRKLQSIILDRKSSNWLVKWTTHPEFLHLPSSSLFCGVNAILRVSVMLIHNFWT